MATVEFDQVTVQPPRGPVLLDDVSLRVEDGLAVALCGPLQGGTSLMLRILAGLESHDEGHILVDGKVVDGLKPRDRDVSLVLPTAENYPHLTVRDNLAFAAEIRRSMTRQTLEERVFEVAELLDLVPLVGMRPSALSPAERQLVALGRALVRDARVYAFDDPLSQLEPKDRDRTRSRVLAWQRDRQRTTLWATNSVAEALAVGDEVAIIHQGHVHQFDTPRDLHDFPIDVFVAGYLSRPPMNMLPGTLRDGVVHVPFLAVPVDDEILDVAGNTESVIVGIRPSACREATTLSPNEQLRNLEFTAVVDEMEWSADHQLAYIGYELDAETVERLERLEEELEHDLFATHLVAALGRHSSIEAGQALRVSVDPRDLHVFDAETGVNLSVLAGP